jgi:hypothetical protein
MNEITLTEKQIIELGWKKTNDTYTLKGKESIKLKWSSYDGGTNIIEKGNVHDYGDYQDDFLFDGWITNQEDLKTLMRFIKLEPRLTKEQIIEIGWKNFWTSNEDFENFNLKSNENISMEWYFKDKKVKITEDLPDGSYDSNEDDPYLVLFNGYITDIDELKSIMHLLHLKY